MNVWDTKSIYQHGTEFTVFKTNYYKSPYTLSVNGKYLAKVKNTKELKSFVKHFGLRFLLDTPK